MTDILVGDVQTHNGILEGTIVDSSMKLFGGVLQSSGQLVGTVIFPDVISIIPPNYGLITYNGFELTVS